MEKLYASGGAMKQYMALCKFPLCLLIAFSTFFGFILAEAKLSADVMVVSIGILLLATGGATLNSLQEKQLDAQMERTRSRPLPSGRITAYSAGSLTVLLIGLGTFVLWYFLKNSLPLVTAIIALVLYNGVYTPLKQRTVLAIVPGAVSGALPPYVGWLAAGGETYTFTAMLLISLFLLWQIPHFLLVVLSYKKDYEKDNIPNLLREFHEEGLKRFFMTWVGALTLVMLLFLILPTLDNLFIYIVITGNGILLFGTFVHRLLKSENINYKQLFILLNCSLFFHMAAISVNRLVF